MRTNETDGSPQTLAVGMHGAPPCLPTAGPGALPSITAPANSIRTLRHGVDSLYLSFRGTIDPRLAVALQEGKVLAQSNKDELVALAGIEVGGHYFTVMPRGRGRFAFVLDDNWFSIQLSNATASSLPLALVQVRSEYLTAVGPEEAIRTATDLVGCMGVLAGSASISRIDLFADFTTTVDLTTLPGAHWVKRSKKRTIHEECDQVTGISFGSGNEVSARLYDKSRELLKSGKFYLEPLWASQGWAEGETVWRMEFQVRREGLPVSMLEDAGDALTYAPALWQYLAGEWLRLALPSSTDDTRTRWPTHPLWEQLVQAWAVPPDLPPLTRVPQVRAPSDQYLFKGGIAGLTSFMAREGITDYGHGLGEFLHALEAYYADPLRHSLESLEGYVGRKARLKARRYNVRVSRHDKD